MRMTDRLECIDDTNKPADFPSNLWVKKGNVYTPDRIDKMNMQGGTLGVVLKEIDTSRNFPYTHFDLRRFRPTQELPTEVLEEVLINELEEVY
jgi:hypothetical protein